MAQTLEKMVVRLEGDATRYNRMLQSAQNRTRQAARQIGAIGRRMTVAITAPLALIGGFAVREFGRFETSLSRVRGLVGLSRESVANFGDEIRNMAADVAVGPSELADALFFITSAGLRGETALDALRASARASTAGLGETKVVADLVTSAMNAFGAETLNATQATDVLVGAVREGKAEAPELAASLGQVLPIASNLGVTFDQVGAAVAAMTTTGTNAQTASIQLRQILASLLNPASEAQNVMEEFGLSAQGVRRQLREEGLLATLLTLKDTFAGNDQAIAQVFGNIRALSGVLDITGANLEKTRGIFSRMRNTTGSLDNAFQAAAETGAVKWAQAMAELQVALISTKDVLGPIIQSVARLIRKGSEAWNAMSDGAKRVAVQVGVVLAGIGPLLIAIGFIAPAAVTGFGLFKTAALSVLNPLKLVSGSVTLLTGTLRILKVAFATAFGPIGLLIAAAAAIIGTFIADMGGVSEAFEAVRKVAADVWGWIQDRIQAFMDFMRPIINQLKHTWAAAWEVIKSAVRAAWGFIQGVVETASGVILGIISTLTGGMITDWEAVRDFIVEVLARIEFGFRNLGAVAGFVWTNIQLGFMLLVDGIRAGAVTVVAGIIASFRAAGAVVEATWINIRGVVTGESVNIADAMRTEFTRAFRDVGQALGGVGESETTRSLRNQRDMQRRSLQQSFAEFQRFRDKRRQAEIDDAARAASDAAAATAKGVAEAAQKATEETNNNALDQGTQAGEQFNRGMASEIGRFDAAAMESAEAFTRIEEFIDRLAGNVAEQANNAVNNAVQPQAAVGPIQQQIEATPTPNIPAPEISRLQQSLNAANSSADTASRLAEQAEMTAIRLQQAISSGATDVAQDERERLREQIQRGLRIGGEAFESTRGVLSSAEEGSREARRAFELREIIQRARQTLSNLERNALSQPGGQNVSVSQQPRPGMPDNGQIVARLGEAVDHLAAIRNRPALDLQGANLA